MNRLVPIFAGRVNNQGRLELFERDNFAKHLLSLREHPVVVTVERSDRRKRSNNQNRYYWGVVVSMIAEFMGYGSDEHEEVHEALKLRFLRIPEDREGDKVVRFESCGSTAALETDQFEEYLSNVRRWMLQEYEFYIPLPNEVELR